jgi:hypothetical protein
MFSSSFKSFRHFYHKVMVLVLAGAYVTSLPYFLSLLLESRMDFTLSSRKDFTRSSPLSFNSLRL